MTDTTREFRLPDAFVFMKVGNHAGEDFCAILERKQRELQLARRIFWGYGGGTCHPLHQVQPFAQKVVRQHRSVYLVMELIDSRADPELLPATQYSTDGITLRGKTFRAVLV